MLLKKFRVKSTIFIILLIFPFLKIPLVQSNSALNSAFNGAAILSSYIILLICFIFVKLQWHTIIFILYQFLYAFSSFINGIPINFVTIISLIALCLLIDFLSRNNPKILLKSLCFYFGFLAALNFVILCFYPNGISIEASGSRVNFLQIDNLLAPILIPIIAFIIIYSLFIRNYVSKISYIVPVLSILTLFYVWPATGLLGLFIFLLHMFFVYNKDLSSRVNIWIYIFISVILHLSIVIFRLQEYFSFIIVDIFNKDLTFANRTDIWDTAMTVIQNSSLDKLIIGYGDRFLLYELTGQLFYAHSHNEILDIILKSGFLGLLLFLILIFISAKNLYKFQNNKIASVLIGVMFSFFIMSMSEKCFTIPFYITLFLSFNIKYIIKKSEVNT